MIGGQKLSKSDKLSLFFVFFRKKAYLCNAKPYYKCARTHQLGAFFVPYIFSGISPPCQSRNNFGKHL